jgi:hypothetical protein
LCLLLCNGNPLEIKYQILTLDNFTYEEFIEIDNKEIFLFHKINENICTLIDWNIDEDSSILDISNLLKQTDGTNINTLNFQTVLFKNIGIFFRDKYHILKSFEYILYELMTDKLISDEQNYSMQYVKHILYLHFSHTNIEFNFPETSITVKEFKTIIENKYQEETRKVQEYETLIRQAIEANQPYILK